MAFKQDEDFLRFITMGAAGTAAVSQHFREAHGHRTIELERYAMANKIWATKIKRLRLADLLCLDCGVRVEARAKSDLKVRMSHSNTPGREWDAGQRETDICAFVPWSEGGPAGSPECFTVGAMRGSVEHAKFGPPKAASEGAERDLTWPTRVAARDCEVDEIRWQTGRVVLKPFVGRRQTVYLRGEVPTNIYVDEGEEVPARRMFVMGCLERPETLACPGSTWKYCADLSEGGDIDRYAAIKAAGFRDEEDVEAELVRIAQDPSCDERIRLEAWASLSRLEPVDYTREVVTAAQNRTAGDPQAMALAMEAIFILSELGTSEAADALSLLAADPTLDSEARCAAVWGLGVAGLAEPARVLPHAADADEDVALHALAGIGPLPSPMVPRVVSMLEGTDIEAASAAMLLGMQGEQGISCLLEAAVGEGRGATWAAGALGELSEADVRLVAGADLDARLERTLTPMWTQAQSWLRRQQADTPLQFLQRQTIRYLA